MIRGSVRRSRRWLAAALACFALTATLVVVNGMLVARSLQWVDLLPQWIVRSRLQEKSGLDSLERQVREGWIDPAADPRVALLVVPMLAQTRRASDDFLNALLRAPDDEHGTLATALADVVAPQV